MASQASVLQLYRDILKAAKRFPSIKRNLILEDIKTEFHANKVCHNNWPDLLCKDHSCLNLSTSSHDQMQCTCSTASCPDMYLRSHLHSIVQVQTRLAQVPTMLGSAISPMS